MGGDNISQPERAQILDKEQGELNTGISQCVASIQLVMAEFGGRDIDACISKFNDELDNLDRLVNGALEHINNKDKNESIFSATLIRLKQTLSSQKDLYESSIYFIPKTELVQGIVAKFDSIINKCDLKHNSY